MKIGKLIDANNNENFIVLITGNDTMTDEISDKIRNIEYNAEKKYKIIIERNQPKENQIKMEKVEE